MKRIQDGIARRWRRFAEQIASATGRYERWRQVDWSRVKRLVFLCSGNICRSPFAEQLARNRGYPAISCGITALSGSAADPAAIRVASHFGVDLSEHRSRALEDIAFFRTDLLLVMDSGHLAAAKTIARRHGCQVTFLGLWDGSNPVAITDPFGGEATGFETSFERIRASLDGISRKYGSA